MATLAIGLEVDRPQALGQVRIFGPRLNDAFSRYLRFGGLPAAVVEASTGALQPSEFTKRILWDSLLKEILRKGASESASRALLERVVRSLGSKTNWSTMAHEMDLPLGRRGGGHPRLQDGTRVHRISRCRLFHPGRVLLEAGRG